MASVFNESFPPCSTCGQHICAGCSPSESKTIEITLRDYFASQIVSQLVGNYGLAPKDAVRIAYETADGMLAERERESK